MDKNTSLKLYLMSNPTLNSEWSAIFSDKYAYALSFTWEVVESPEFADVIAWDGVITPKLELYIDRIFKRLENHAILLLQGEARTLYENNPYVKSLKLDQLRYVELPGWSVLPEEILMALTVCHQKLNHV